MTNAEKLDGVNFEKEFNSECAEKKRIARGELARKKGGGKICRLLLTSSLRNSGRINVLRYTL